MDTCSYKSEYWSAEEKKEVPFECDYKKQEKSDMCIFHDPSFLDNQANREIVEFEFQDKVDKHFSNGNNGPFLCVGYRLHNLHLQNKEFSTPVYFDNAYIVNSLRISSKFLKYVSFSGAEFSGNDGVSFVGAEFLGEGNVSFEGAEFVGNCDISFRGARFLGNGGVNFDNAEFSAGQGDVSFVDAQFSASKGYVSFGRALFSGEGGVSFSGASFSGEGVVYFNGARFSGEGGVSFTGTKFSLEGGVHFDTAQFSGVGVFFDGAKFSLKGGLYMGGIFSGRQGVYFAGVEFSAKGGVHFDVARFSGYTVSFKGATFSGEIISFKGIKLSGTNIYFDKSKFSGDVLFNGAEFFEYDELTFEDAKFLGGNVLFDTSWFIGKSGCKVAFTKVQFIGKGKISYTDSLFLCGNVSFSEARFIKDGDVSFDWVVFLESDISFERATFLGEGDVTFNGASFSGNVHFNAVHFLQKGGVFFNAAYFSGQGEVFFNRAKFSGPVSFINSKFRTSVFFRFVNFMSPEQVQFLETEDFEDLSMVSFLNTDITRITFGENTRFGRSESKKERFKILDEIRFEKSIDKKERITNSNLIREKLSLGTILTSYRNLRENYEYRLRYEEAGQFFVREMEIRRKYREEFSSDEGKYIPKRNNWFIQNFSFTGLYYNICKYGENSTRPIILFGIIMLLSTIYWFISSEIGLSLQKSLLTSTCNEHLILCSIERTLDDIVSFPEKGIIVDYITRISSLIVLATLLLPFRRKFERRFRH